MVNIPNGSPKETPTDRAAVSDDEVTAVAVFLETNALDRAGQKLDAVSARLMARRVVEIAAEARGDATLPRIRASE